MLGRGVRAARILLAGCVLLVACGESRQGSEAASTASAPVHSEGGRGRGRGRAPDRLRVLTYNIRHGEGMDSVINLKRVARVIERLEPDVVALQEIDSAVERSFGVNQIAVLGELTGMHAAFGDFFDYQGGRYGMGILSRSPIIEHTNYRLPDGEEPRSALAVRLTVGESELVVVGVHLYATEAERQAQAERLVQLFADEKSPVILAGDFNSTPDSEVISLLARYWEIPDKGDDQLTFPSNAPEREIDYIMFRPAERFEVIGQRAISEPAASDHRPVLLDLRIR